MLVALILVSDVPAVGRSAMSRFGSLIARPGSLVSSCTEAGHDHGACRAGPQG